MKSGITNISFFNYDTKKTLGNLRTGWVGISELGLLETEPAWIEDLDGTTRVLTANPVKARTYNITVLSDTYDSTTRSGDRASIALLRTLNGSSFKEILWGVIQTIDRDRFACNDNTLYSTTYTLYSANPLWYAGSKSTPPAEYEGDNMSLVKTWTNALTVGDWSETLTFNNRWFNTKRGYKITVKVTYTETSTSASFYRLKINDKWINAYQQTLPPISDEVIYFLQGLTLRDTNARYYTGDNWTSNFMPIDAYTDEADNYLQVDKNIVVQYTGQFQQSGTIEINLYSLLGEYF